MSHDEIYNNFCIWLVEELAGRGFTLEPEYEAYIWGMLETESDVFEFLKDFINGSPDEVSQLSSAIYSKYKSFHQINTDSGAGHQEMAADIEVKKSLVFETASIIAEPLPENNDSINDDVFLTFEDDPGTELLPGFDNLDLAFELEDYLIARGGICEDASFSFDAICCALYSSGGRLEAAAEILSRSYECMLSCKPCRHMLQGGCYRSDCWFDHDFRDTPCRYWLLAGTGCSTPDCTFMHELIVTSATSEAKEGPVVALDSEQFPELVSIPAASLPKSDRPNQMYVDKVMARLPYQKSNSSVQRRSSEGISRARARESFSMTEWVSSGATQMLF